jgi:PhnB protein
MAVKPIPDGYHTVTPYLIMNDCKKALEFYKRAFNATELMCMDMGGRVGHAELQIGDSRVMMADEFPDMVAIGPKTLGGTSVGLVLYVEDVDALFDQAIRAGATVVQAVTNQFYGDRMGTLLDPFGHKWSIGTHIEDVEPEEIERRKAAMKPS